MKPKLLITQFRLDLPKADYEALVQKITQAIAEVPGMCWKIWTHHPAGDEAGGVYLFESENAAAAFLNGPIIAGLEGNSLFRDINFKLLDILPGPTAITNGPIN